MGNSASWPLASIGTAALIALAACGGDTASDEVAISLPPQIGVPTAATVQIATTELTYDSQGSVSPSGAARVGHDERGWCLEDASGVRCLRALSEESGGDAIRWRDDEQAIAVTFSRQDPISIIDFAAGSVVETDLDSHRILDWAPDGTSLLGLTVDEPNEIRRLDPETLDASDFTTFDGPWIPQLRWVTRDVIWGSTTNTAADVFTLDGNGDRSSIEGGLGEQRFKSFSADGRFALTEDNDIARGRGEDDDPIIWIFDSVEQRSAGVDLPPGITDRSYTGIQLSADGNTVLLLSNGRDVGVLWAGTVDPDTLAVSGWVEIAGWPSEERFEPSVFSANGTLHWDGSDTAWAISDGEELIEIVLS